MSLWFKMLAAAALVVTFGLACAVAAVTPREGRLPVSTAAALCGTLVFLAMTRERR